jgi:ABC-2 type transport system permease protein
MEVTMLNLLRYELRKRRNAIIGWSIGMALYVVYVMVLFPAIGDQYAAMMENLNLNNPLFQMFGDFGAMASFSGFFNLYVLEYVPLLLAIYAITNGTGALAGEEEEGTLELLLSLPLPRWQIVIAKALAMTIAVLIIVALTAGSAAATFVAMEEQIGPVDVTAAELFAVMVFMMLGLFMGAFLPRRRLAAMIVTIALVVSFFGNNLAVLSDTLEALQPLFPFYYFEGADVIENGMATGDVLALAGASVAFLLLAIVSFQRRNVTVGAWPWQRGRVPAS